jgi:ELWxxDGT repeat protein
MRLSVWSRRGVSTRQAARGQERTHQLRLHLEPLEDRSLLASGLSATLVADLVPGPDSSEPEALTNVGGTLYFGALATGAYGLWKSDGTAAGTVLVKGNLGGYLDNFTPMNGSVFFEVRGGADELWKTDGTEAGTIFVHSVSGSELTPVNGKLFFAHNGTDGTELWVSDGTTAGTVLLKDIYPGTTTVTLRDFNKPPTHTKVTYTNSSSPQSLTNLNGTLFFTATDGTNGRELWKSDGTAQGTVLVKDIANGSQSSNPRYLTVVNGVLYFAAAGGLWKSDGTGAGTVLVKNVNAAYLKNVDGTLFFAGTNKTSGMELWKSDGTTAGTVMVKDINPGSAGSLTDWQLFNGAGNGNGRLYFFANDGVHGMEPWTSDGTAAGTALLKDINQDVNSGSSGGQFTNVNGLVYFNAIDPVNGYELWQTDGTTAGTVVQDIYPGSQSSVPNDLTSFSNKLYFTAFEPEHGRELWDPPPVGNYTPGPLVLISHPDPLADSPGVLGTDVAAEPYVAVNPTNPLNIAASWMDQYPNGNAVSVTLDGGVTWRNVLIPGFTPLTGGTSRSAFDPWLSFDPNGNLYSSGGAGLPKGNAQFLVNKSADGGLSWSSAIRVNTPGNDGNGWGPYGDDKPSITADPANPNYVYMTWARFNEASSFKGQSAETMFARSIDGGLTWQTEQSIHTAPKSDILWGHQIVVLPDGTLLDAFTEGKFTNNHQASLTLLRSTDHGLTWSAPISALVQQPLVDPQDNPPNATVIDPDTGHPVEAHPMFPSIAVDQRSGNLYAVWIDARFSNFQYNSIAFSMSTDGGFTWSTPSQVNQTPNSVPVLDRQAWNPTVAVAADGTVGVTYYDFRNNTAAPGALTDYWLATAPTPASNPTAWGEMRLTDNSFDLEQAPTRFGGDTWLGDYEGLAAAGNDFVAAWAMPDGSATGQECVFFRRAISGAPLQAAAVGQNRFSPTMTAHQVDGLLPEAHHRWQDAGIATPIPSGIDVRVADLGGTTLGLAFGHTVWRDDNTSGWGWFVGMTPSNDSELARRGDQGEPTCMDLLIVRAREVGHLLGRDHGQGGVMAKTLATGELNDSGGVYVGEPGMFLSPAQGDGDSPNRVTGQRRLW